MIQFMHARAHTHTNTQSYFNYADQFMAVCFTVTSVLLTMRDI
jgi:hypothetical protein